MEEDAYVLPCNAEPGLVEPSWLEWYLYAAGFSLVPREFTWWCGMAALSACVANRVWYEKFKGERLTANLFTMLLGPSGVGKNQAIRRAVKRVESAPSGLACANPYRGKMSAQGILTYLAKSKKQNFVWLVTPELAMQVGNGPKAEDFVTHMTEMLDSDQRFQDLTRTHGHHVVHSPCVNWTSGTNYDWLVRSIGRADILGGFFARIFPVPGERVGWRIPRPVFPDDYEAVNQWLEDYVEALLQVEGEMTMTEAGAGLHTWWVNERVEPVDEALWPFYNHGDNLLIKLCMVFALADRRRLDIDYDHVSNAIALYEWVYERLPDVMEYAYRTPDVEKLDLVAAYIKRSAAVEHAHLLRHASNRGVDRAGLDGLVKTLIERGDVRAERGETGRAYRWIGGE